MDMIIVKSLADHLVSIGWSMPVLTRHLKEAESESLYAIATAIDKGITLDELREGVRMAIRIKQETA